MESNSTIQPAKPNVIEKGSGQAFIPPSISSVEDTGLSPLWLQDLILKVMYFQDT